MVKESQRVTIDLFVTQNISKLLWFRCNSFFRKSFLFRNETFAPFFDKLQGMMLRCVKIASGGSRISQRGAPTYYLAKICQKLHENEENWTDVDPPQHAGLTMLCTRAKMFRKSFLLLLSGITTLIYEIKS